MGNILDLMQRHNTALIMQDCLTFAGQSCFISSDEMRTKTDGRTAAV